MKSKFVPYEGFSKVKVRKYSESPWSPDNETMEQINKRWNEKILESKLLYDGPMARVSGMWQEGSDLNLDLQRTSYKYHLGTIREQDPLKRANGLFAAVNAITADDKLILGEVANGLYEKRVNICAGSVDPEMDYIDGLPSIKSAMEREIKEELFLDPSDFDSLVPTYIIVEEDRPHPSIMHIGRISLDSEEVKRKFKDSLKCASQPELGTLYFVDASEKGISDYLKENPKGILGRVSIILQDLIDNPERLEV